MVGYADISQLTNQLRNETKITARRKAGRDLVKYLTDPRVQSKIEKEARSSRKAIVAMWNNIISSALCAATKGKTKKSAEDLMLPFRLLRICDGTDQQRDAEILINGTGTKLSGDKVHELVRYCLDMLAESSSNEIPELEALKMLSYLLSKPHYIACLRTIEVENCLDEIYNRIISESSSAEPILVLEAAKAFSGIIVGSCSMRIGLHGILSRCIDVVSKWCYLQKRNFASVSQSSILFHIYSVAINLMASHPEECVASIVKNGKVLLSFAENCFQFSTGQNKDILIEYFSAHLLICEVAGKLQGFSHGDLGNIGSSSLDLKRLLQLLHKVASKGEIEKVCTSIDASTLSSQRRTFHKNLYDGNFPKWSPLHKRQRRHLELCAHLLSHAQRQFCANDDISTYEGDLCDLFLLHGDSDGKKKSHTKEDTMVMPSSNFSKSPWVLFALSHLFRFLIQKDESASDSRDKTKISSTTSESPEQHIQSYLQNIFDDSRNKTGVSRQKVATITPILQLICSCAEAFPNGNCWATSSSYWMASDGKKQSNEQIFCTLLDLSVLVYLLNHILSLSGGISNEHEVQIWCLMSLLKLAKPSALITSYQNYDGGSSSALDCLAFSWKNVLNTLTRVGLRYSHYTSGTDPDSAGDLVLMLISEIIDNFCFSPHTLIEPSYASSSMNSSISSFQSDIFSLPVFKKPQEIKSSAAFELILVILQRMGLLDDGKDVLPENLPNRYFCTTDAESLRNIGRRYRLVIFCIQFIETLMTKNHSLVHSMILPSVSSCISSLVSGNLVLIPLKFGQDFDLRYSCTEDSFALERFNNSGTVDRWNTHKKDMNEMYRPFQFWGSFFSMIRDLSTIGIHKFDDDERIWRLLSGRGPRLFHPTYHHQIMGKLERILFCSKSLKSEFIPDPTRNLLKSFVIKSIGLQTDEITTISPSDQIGFDDVGDTMPLLTDTNLEVQQRLVGLLVILQISISICNDSDINLEKIVSSLSRTITMVMEDVTNEILYLSSNSCLFNHVVTYVETFFEVISEIRERDVESMKKIPECCSQAGSTIYEKLKKMILLYEKTTKNFSSSIPNNNCIKQSQSYEPAQSQSNAQKARNSLYNRKREHKDVNDTDDENESDFSMNSEDESISQKKHKRRKNDSSSSVQASHHFPTSLRSKKSKQSNLTMIAPDTIGARRCASLMLLLNPSIGSLESIVNSFVWPEGEDGDEDSNEALVHPQDIVFCLELFSKKRIICREFILNGLEKSYFTQQSSSNIIKSQEHQNEDSLVHSTFSLCTEILCYLRSAFGSSVYSMYGFKYFANILETRETYRTADDNLGDEDILHMLELLFPERAMGGKERQHNLKVFRRQLKHKPSFRVSQVAGMNHAFSRAQVLHEEFGDFIVARLRDREFYVRVGASEGVGEALKNFEAQDAVVKSILANLVPLSPSDRGSEDNNVAQWIIEHISGRHEPSLFGKLGSYLERSYEASSIFCIGIMAGSTPDVTIAREQIFSLICLSADRPELQFLCLLGCKKAASLRLFDSIDDMMKFDSNWLFHKWIRSKREIHNIPLIMSSPSLLTKMLDRCQGQQLMDFIISEYGHENEIKNLKSKSRFKTDQVDKFDNSQMIEIVDRSLETYICDHASSFIPIILLLNGTKKNVKQRQRSGDMESIFKTELFYLREIIQILSGKDVEEYITKILKAHIHDIYSYITLIQNQANDISEEEITQSRAFSLIKHFISDEVIHKKILKNSHRILLQLLRLSGEKDTLHVATQQEVYAKSLLSLSEKLSDLDSQTFDATNIFHQGDFSITVCLLHVRKWLQEAKLKDQKHEVWNTFVFIIESALKMLKKGVKKNVQIGFCINTILGILGDSFLSDVHILALKQLNLIFHTCFPYTSITQKEIVPVLNDVIVSLLKVHDEAKQRFASIKIETKNKNDAQVRRSLGILCVSDNIDFMQNMDISQSIDDSFYNDSTEQEPLSNAKEIMILCYDVLELVLLKSPATLNDMLSMLDPLPVSSFTDQSSLSHLSDHEEKFSLKKLLENFNNSRLSGLKMKTLEEESLRFIAFAKRCATSTSTFTTSSSIENETSLHVFNHNGNERTEFLSVSNQSKIASLHHLLKVIQKSNTNDSMNSDNLTPKVLYSLTEQLWNFCREGASHYVSFAASRCLGELSSSSYVSLLWSTMPNTYVEAKSVSHYMHFGDTENNISPSDFREDPLIAIKLNSIILLSRYVTSPDVNVALTATQTAQGILNTKEGMEFWSKINDEGVKRVLDPLVSKTSSIKSSSIDTVQVVEQLFSEIGINPDLALTSKRWCWDSKYWICEEKGTSRTTSTCFSQWIKNLVCCIIYCCYNNSVEKQNKSKDESSHFVEGSCGFFSICLPMAFVKQEFASCIFPGIVYDLLSNKQEGGNKHSESENQDRVIDDVRIGDSSSKANKVLSKCFHNIIGDLSPISKPIEPLSQKEQSIHKENTNIHPQAICLALDTLDFLRTITEYRFSNSKHHKFNISTRKDRPNTAGNTAGTPSTADAQAYNSNINPSPLWCGRLSGVVLHVGLLNIAYACVKVNRYASALFYGSMFADNHLGGAGEVLCRIAGQCSDSESYEHLSSSSSKYTEKNSNNDLPMRQDSDNMLSSALSLQNLIKICFTKLQEYDGLKGVEAQGSSIRFKMGDYLHATENFGRKVNTPRSLQEMINLDSRLQASETIFSCDNINLAIALKDLGLRHVANNYIAGQNSLCAQQTLNQTEQNFIKEELFEKSWRNMLWDDTLLSEQEDNAFFTQHVDAKLSQNSPSMKRIDSERLPQLDSNSQTGVGFHESLNNSLLFLRKKDLENYKSCISKSRLNLVKELENSTLVSQVIALAGNLQILNELDDVERFAFCDAPLDDLLRKWNIQENNNGSDLQWYFPSNSTSKQFVSEELLYSVREVVLRVMYKKLCLNDNGGGTSSLLSHMRNFCTLSQKHGNADVARTSLMRMYRFIEFQKVKEVRDDSMTIMRLQLQMEEAKILRCSGNINAGIRKVNLLVDLLKEKRRALRIAEGKTEIMDRYLVNYDLDLLLSQAFLASGKWLTSYKMKPAMSVLRSHLEPAFDMAKLLHKKFPNVFTSSHSVDSSLTLAVFAANLYADVTNRVKSHEWRKAGEASKQRILELERCEQMYHDSRDKYNRAKQKRNSELIAKQEAELQDIVMHTRTLQKEISIDEKERSLIEKSQTEFLILALVSFGNGLSISCPNEQVGDLSSHVFRMISLWFENCSNLEVNKLMAHIVETAPSYRFVPLTYQLFSRIDEDGNVESENSFQSSLRSIVMKICIEHPYHGLVQLIALANGNNIGSGVCGRQRNAYLENVGDSKVEVANSILSDLQESAPEYVSNLIESYKGLTDSYIDLAMAPTEKFHRNNKQRTKGISLTEVSLRGRDSSLDRCLGSKTKNNLFPCLPCILTKPPLLRPRGDYGDGESDPIGTERVIGFEPTFSLTETGLHRPKIVICKGSQGGRFKQLVKGEDDIRQDAIMQQVFCTVNELLTGRKRSSNTNNFSLRNRGSHQLKISTYNIVPLSPASGVLEWVNDTIPFGDYLLDKKSRSGRKVGAHSKYYPGEWGMALCRTHFKDSPSNVKLQTFNEICRHFSPAFRFFFLERFQHSPQAWHDGVMSYTRSSAVTSIVGHVLGIGDRHSHNILIHEKTGEVVHIDFGIVFEQGKCLPTAENVPFRLTRDIVDGFGPAGVEGTFTSSSELTSEVLRESSTSLLTILSAVVNDPLYKWSVSPVKARQRQMEDNNLLAKGNDGIGDQEQENKNEAAQRAITKISEKLQGYEEGTGGEQQSVEGQVQLLINSARDPENLCKMYVGWCPWL